MLCLALYTAQAQTSTFDTNDEGWSIVSFTNLSTDSFGIVGTYAAIYNSTGGNPGGFISNNDPDGGDATFSAPASFLGDRSVAVGTMFSYDLIHSGSNNYNATDLIFQGNGMSLLWEASPDLMPTTTWMNVAVTLAPSAQWHLNTHNGALATMSDFQSVFANLTGVFVRGEYTTGGESDGIDNVNFVPEPATTSLLLLSLGATAIVWKKRRAAN